MAEILTCNGRKNTGVILMTDILMCVEGKNKKGKKMINSPKWWKKKKNSLTQGIWDGFLKKEKTRNIFFQITVPLTV